MPQNAAKELLQDRNNNQQIDIDDIKSNIKNFHDMKSLAKEIKEEKEEIKEKTFEVIKGFYEENKEALTELDDDEMKILTLGKELGIIKGNKSPDSKQYKDIFGEDMYGQIQDLISENKEQGLSNQEMSDVIWLNFGQDLIDSVKERCGNENGGENIDFIWKGDKEIKPRINDFLDEIINEENDKKNNLERKDNEIPENITTNENGKQNLDKDKNKEESIKNLKGKEPILDTEDNDLSVNTIPPQNIQNLSKDENQVQDESKDQNKDEGGLKTLTPKPITPFSIEKPEPNITIIPPQNIQNLSENIVDKDIPILKQNFDQLKDKIDHDVLTGDIDPTKIQGWKSELKKIQDDFTKKFPDDEKESSVLGDEYRKSRGIDLGTRKDDMKMLDRKIDDTQENLCVDDLIEAEKCVDEVVVLSNDEEQVLTDQKENEKKENEKKEKERQDKIDALLAKTNTLVERNILNDLGNRPETVGKENKDEVINLLTRIEAKIIPLDVPERYPDLGDRSEKLQSNLELAKDEWNLIPTHPGIITTQQYTGPIDIKGTKDFSTPTQDLTKIDAKPIKEFPQEFENPLKDLEVIINGGMLPEVEIMEQRLAKLNNQVDEYLRNLNRGSTPMTEREETDLMDAISNLLPVENTEVNMTEKERELYEKLIGKTIVLKGLLETSDLLERNITAMDPKTMEEFSKTLPEQIEKIKTLQAKIESLPFTLDEKNILTAYAKDAMDKLNDKQSLLTFETNKLDILARDNKTKEEKREEDKKYPLEKMISKRTEFLENKVEVEELMKLNPNNYTEAEKENFDKMGPLTAALNIRNFEDELAMIEEENNGKWKKDVLDNMLGKLTSLLNDANSLYDMTSDDNEYKDNLKTAIDRLKDAMSKLNTKKLSLDAEAVRLEMQAKEEKAKEEERNKDKERMKENPLEKLSPIRAKFIAIENQVNEDMKLNPINYTEAEKERIEKMKPLITTIDLKNLEDEIREINTNNEGVWPIDELNNMIGRLDPLLTDATKEFETTPEDNPYKNNLKTAIDRLKDAMDKLNAKKLLLDAEALRLDMQAKEENAKEEERNKDKERTKANPLEKLTPIRAKFIAIENQVNEDMRLFPERYTQDEKERLENMKPLITTIDLKNLEDEIREINTNNEGVWPIDELNNMIGRLDPLLTDATKEFETTPEDNPYKNNLKTAIDRLKDAMDKLNAKKLLLDAEALRLDMQAKEENAKEEERNKDKERTKANPLEKLTPIRAKFIAIENQINEDMRLNPDNYTEAEKLNIEKLKPLDMAIILKNMDDELLTRGLENNNNRDIDDLKSFLPKLTDILDQAVDLYTTIPENNPYKKNLKDAMLPLDAKKIIMNNQIQELEFKNRNLDAPENFTENLPVLQTRLSELDNSIDALELAKKDIDDKQLLAKIDEDIFKMKSKQSQINELGLLQEMNNRPVYTPDLKTLQAEIDEEENKKIPSTDKNISENNQDKKKTVPTTVDYNSKNKEDDKLFDDFKNSFIPTTSNQSNDVKPDVLYTTSTDNNNTIPILTYESIPEDNENKQALDQINSDEKNVADKFKEKYNRDINTIGSVSNKLLVNVMNKNASGDEEKWLQAVHNRGGVYYFDVSGKQSRNGSARAFNDFVMRDVNDDFKVDWDSQTLINDLKNQYEAKKKLYLKTLSSGVKKIENITQLYTDNNGTILKHKITPDNKNKIINQLEDARLDLTIAGKIFGGIDNVIATNLIKINSYEQQINTIFIAPVAKLETKKIETKKPVITISEQERKNREILIHSYRVERQENGDKNKNTGNYELAKIAYKKASDLLIQIEKIDPTNAYIPKEKKYLSEVVVTIDNQIRIAQEEKNKKKIAPTLVENKTNINEKKEDIVVDKTSTESIIQTGDLYLQKYNTKFDYDSFKKALDSYHKAKLMLEADKKLEPNNTQIDDKLKIVNELIENIGTVRFIEQEIVVWHQRAKNNNTFSMARFLINVFEESSGDDAEKALYGKYFKNPQVKERSLNHAINVIKSINSANGFTLPEDHYDGVTQRVEPNTKKGIHIQNSQLRSKLVNDLNFFNTTPEFKQFIKDKMGIILKGDLASK